MASAPLKLERLDANVSWHCVAITKKQIADINAAISAIPAGTYVDAIALILANYPSAHTLDDADYIELIIDRDTIWTPHGACNGRRLYKTTIEHLEDTDARYAKINEEISQLDTSAPIWKIKELRDCVFWIGADTRRIASNRFAEIAVAISALDENTYPVFDEELAARLASVDTIYNTAKRRLDQKRNHEPVGILTKLYKQIKANTERS